ncbi:MAG: MBL fold metallo-hydrolase [Candidatus Bathyarchaeia archaeon]
MKIRFLGACREVGRSAVAIDLDGSSILLDYGVIMDHEVGFPIHIPPRELKAIILTHAHLDHSGLLPLFYIKGEIPIYAVEPTFQLTDLLVKDLIRLSGYYLPYEYIDLQNMMNYCIDLGYRRKISLDGFNDLKITLLDAGHIPGSCQALIEGFGKRILYTGDFNRVPTRLTNPAEEEYSDLDAIVIEGTYANEEHPNRKDLEKEFVSSVDEIVENDGIVLVPAFGVGRSQEIVSILVAQNFEHRIFIDGMALDTIEILMNYKNVLSDPNLFEKAMHRAEWIKNWHERRKAVKSPSVIISPAGMLKGGAAVFYMEKIAREKKNGVFLVSYQIPGTPGSILLEKKRFMIHGKSRKVEAEVKKFDFSSHSGKKELEDTLSKLDGKTKVFVVHGNEENCVKLADRCSKELGLEASAPMPGDAYEL